MQALNPALSVGGNAGYLHWSMHHSTAKGVCPSYAYSQTCLLSLNCHLQRSTYVRIEWKDMRVIWSSAQPLFHLRSRNEQSD